MCVHELHAGALSAAELAAWLPCMAGARAGVQCKRSTACLARVKDFLQPDCLQGCYKSVPHQVRAALWHCGALRLCMPARR